MRYMVLGFVLVGLLAIQGAMAATQGTGQVAVSGSIQPTCSITVSPATLAFGTMVAGQSYYSNVGNVHVGCNIQPWAVIATDDTTGSKPAGHLWNITGSIAMNQPFQIYNGAGFSTLLTPETYAQGTSVGGFDFPVEFYQTVAESDVPAIYQTTVTFTLTA
jgi:hypothetical protein